MWRHSRGRTFLPEHLTKMWMWVMKKDSDYTDKFRQKKIRLIMQVLERILNRTRVLFLWMLWVHDVQEAGSQCLAHNYSHLFLSFKNKILIWLTSLTDNPRSDTLWCIFAQGDPIQRLTKLPHTRPSYVGRVLYIDQMLSSYAQAQHTDRKHETVPSHKQ